MPKLILYQGAMRESVENHYCHQCSVRTLSQILREKERERERGRGGREREIWNDRGGERGELRERRNIIGRRESPLIHHSRDIVQITHWQYDIL